MIGFRIFHLAAPPLAWAALIFFLSGQPAPEPIAAAGISDKMLHACAYAVLAALVLRWLTANRQTPIWYALTVTVLVSGLYGVFDEVHQAFVVSRFPEVADAWADLAGAVVGAGILGALIAYHRAGHGKQQV